MKGIIISLVGALLSLTLSILGIYTIFRSTHLSLPLPALAPILSALIPLPNALGLWHYLRRLHSPPNANKRPTTIFTPGEILTLLTILDTILLTLAATYLSPRGLLSCALESRWRALFETHDARDIRRIQDALECCGFRSTVDKAWPFPDGEHAADACVVRYGRGRRCLEGWEGQGRGLLGVMVLVGVSTLVSKLVVLLVLRFRPAWLGTVGTGSWQGDTAQTQPRRITGQGVDEQRITEAPYSDDPEVGGERDERRSDEESALRPLYRDD